MKKPVTFSEDLPRHAAKWTLIRPWLLSWEIYLIVVIAAILRLYRLDTSEFSGDQTILFRMAYDAVHYSLIPATSNSSSILTGNPPLAVYFLMIPALFSPDPLWATVMTALFNVVAVLLTYIFVRRYYGRLPATIAALLYASAQTTIVFSRFIWQPTLLAPFVVLFMFALFRGVVERRKGWLFPAILLLGVMVQLHEITILLVILLLAAIVFAPQTIRLRDCIFGFVSLFIIYAPFLLWQAATRFADLHLILNSTNVHPVIDGRAITFYSRFLNSYYYDDEFLHGTFYDPTGSAHSAVFKILPILVLARYVLELCLLAGFAWATWLIVRPRGKGDLDETSTILPGMPSRFARFFSGLAHWWSNLRANPKACGLVLMLLWQIVPIVALTRHGLQIHLHYLLMIVPGPYIFIGIGISRVIAWFRRHNPVRLWNKVSYYGTYALVVCLLLVQLLGSSASLVDMTNGINNHIFGYNDIGSLEHAFQEADRVAQQHHLSRVYVTLSVMDDFDSLLVGFPYLASQMHTPATLFESTGCLVLPSPGEGSAVMLMRSTDTLTAALLSHFATATLVNEPSVLGSTPFKLYILTPRRFTQSASTNLEFAGQLRLIDAQLQAPGSGMPPRLISRWTLLQNAQPASRTTYNYMMSETPNLPGAASTQSPCLLTSMRASDQLVVAFPISRNDMAAHTFSITSQFLVKSPDILTLGALRFETYKLRDKLATLRDANGSESIMLSLAPVA